MACVYQVVLFVFLGLLACFKVSFGYGSGAPPNSCVHMTPGHFNDSVTPEEPLVPQEIESPYTVTASPSKFGPGDEITVTIGGSGTENFYGFFIQARPEGEDTPVGSFSDLMEDHMKFVPECSSTYENAAVTHANQKSNPMAFDSIVLKWTAPDSEVGDITFYATVAQNHDIYWVKLESEKLTYNGFTVLTPSLSLLVLPIAAIFTRYL